MTEILRTLSYVARALGAIQIMLGISFWTGHLYNLVPLHVLLGLTIVSLLVLAALLGLRQGASLVRVGIALAWAALVVWMGYQQVGLLPGPYHWIVQVAHLVVGLAALGQVEGFARATGGGVRWAPAAEGVA